MSRACAVFILILVVTIGAVFILSLSFYKDVGRPTYGASFSRFHTNELGLDWKETYLALLKDLNIKHFRFSAHWPITEPEKDEYNFAELDFQIAKAQEGGASVILAVGRRLPGWPECHEPDWLMAESLKLKAKSEIKKYKQERTLKYIETVVNRYKSYNSIIYWQVENEPFLTGFSRSECGPLDKEFLEKEIDMVRKLDNRPVLVTDSGEFGDWFRAYSLSDVFGSSLYLYVWPRSTGFPIRYPILPSFFRLKHNIVRLILGAKPTFVVELSAEPWLLQPIVETPVGVQLDRMGIDKFNEVIDFSSKTGFNGFYLWGAEWWYWLKLNGHPEHWERARELFKL